MTTGFESPIDHFGLGLTKDDLVGLYRKMLISRRLDEKIWALNRQGRIPFVVSVSGHEATQIGIAAALDPERDCSFRSGIIYKILLIKKVNNFTPYER